MANNILSFCAHKKSATTNQNEGKDVKRNNANIIELLEVMSSAGLDLTPIFDSFIAHAKSN
ncbi:hypothetical protein [Vibrio parahaemolyticus]|uniref:hypothetical protein n=1 Tax=Vibrio parahaemolyticus TaxID=670 RepID=UPI00235EA1C2|nr:hypothetical protein [Vibrio parahaemolyticus]